MYLGTRIFTMVEEKYKCEVREDEEESCDDMFELEVINVKS